jgi:pimeloyl-ACP methyl ester carboxylesterase
MAEHAASTDDLAFTISNPSGKTTILLLHALFSSPLEYAFATPAIPSDYCVIIPYLPQHSASLPHHQHFSLTSTTKLLARLITAHSSTGTVHVAGVDLGGFVALELLRSHPQLIESVFITGCYPYTKWQAYLASWPSLMSWGLYLTIQSGLYRAAAATSGIPRHDDLVAELLKNNTYDLSARAYKEMRTWQAEETRDVAMKDKRILVCASGMGDDVDATKEFAEMLKGLGQAEGKETKAVEIRDAIHGWNLQLGKLFAETLVAWIEKRPLPERLEAL